MHLTQIPRLAHFGDNSSIGNVNSQLHNYDLNSVLKREILTLCNNTFDYNSYTFINTSNLMLYKRKKRLSNSKMYKKYYNNYKKSNFNYLRSIDKYVFDNKLNLNSLNLGTTMWVDFKENYIYCPSHKVASTKVKLIFYYISLHIHKTGSAHAATNLESSLPHFQGLNFHVFHYRQEWNKVLFKTKNDKNGKYFQRFVFIRDPLKRLLSGFIDKCIVSKQITHCSMLIDKKYSNIIGNEYKFFEAFVNQLHDIVFVDKTIYSLDKHFRPQFYICHMFDLISTFDFILIYDKIHFMSNMKYIVKQVIENNNNNENDNINITDEYIDNKYFNDKYSLTYRRHSTTDKSELKLLKEYYTREIAIKALEIYSLDYRWLPLPPPLWILDLE